MKKLLVDGNLIQMATDWSEVTLGQYMLLCKHIQEQEQVKSSLTEVQTLLSNIKVLEIMCNAQDEELDSMTKDELSNLINELSFIETIPSYPVAQTVNINGVLYAFIKDYNTLTTGESISINVYLENAKGNAFGCLHQILAVLLRPATEVINPVTGSKEYQLEKFSKKNIEYINDRAELFKAKLTVPDFYATVNFFLNGNKESINNMTNSLNQNNNQLDNSLPESIKQTG